MNFFSGCSLRDALPRKVRVLCDWRIVVTLIFWVSSSSQEVSFAADDLYSISQGKKEQVSFEPGPVLPRPEAVFQDPFGANTWLRNHGISILFDTTNEVAGNVTRPSPNLGLRRGVSNAGQDALVTDIDMGKLIGWHGFSYHSAILSRYGTSVSRMFGDNGLNTAQEIYGAGGNVVAHLIWMYFEQSMFNNILDIEWGRLTFLNDFSANPYYCTFMNNLICGNPKGSTDNVARTAWPDGQWGTRIRVRIAPDISLSTGVYFSETNNVYTNNGFRTGWKFNGSNIDGEVIPFKILWSPKFGRKKDLPGNYEVGFTWDNAKRNSNLWDVNGKPFALTGLPPRKISGTWGAWLMADQMLHHHKGGEADEGLTALGFLYWNQPDALTRNTQVVAGMIDRGFWRKRPRDMWGFYFAYQDISNSLGFSQRLFYEKNLRIPNGALFPQKNAYVIEATYQIHVYRGMTFAPDFQYFIHPGGQSNLKDQAVIGFKSHVQVF